MRLCKWFGFIAGMLRDLLAEGRKKMFERTNNKEITGRNEKEKQNISTLRDFHLCHIEKWGVS